MVIQFSSLLYPKEALFVSATYGSDEAERRAIVDFITSCVEEAAAAQEGRGGRASNVTEIMAMCASFASDPPVTMTANAQQEEEGA